MGWSEDSKRILERKFVVRGRDVVVSVLGYSTTFMCPHCKIAFVHLRVGPQSMGIIIPLLCLAPIKCYFVDLRSHFPLVCILICHPLSMLAL